MAPQVQPTSPLARSRHDHRRPRRIQRSHPLLHRYRGPHSRRQMGRALPRHVVGPRSRRPHCPHLREPCRLRLPRQDRGAGRDRQRRRLLCEHRRSCSGCGPRTSRSAEGLPAHRRPAGRDRRDDRWRPRHARRGPDDHPTRSIVVVVRFIDWLATRVVELTVHSLDLARTAGRPTSPWPPPAVARCPMASP